MNAYLIDDLHWRSVIRQQTTLSFAAIYDYLTQFAR